MGSADHRIYRICYPHRTQRHILYGDLGKREKGKKVKK